MKLLTIALLITCFGEFTFAEECNSYTKDAKFVCANVGDTLAAKGDYAGAKNAWKISCANGLSSSCDSVKELDQNPSKFKMNWESDPSNRAAKEFVEKKEKVEKEMAEKNAKVAECSKPGANNSNCISNAKSLLSKGDPAMATAIYNSLCNENNGEACFELGGIYVRAGNYDKAIQPYMTACSLGNSNSCVILQQVQTNVKMKSEEKAREEEKQRQIAAEEQRRHEKFVETIQASSKAISDSFKPPKKTSCTTSAVFGQLQTDCTEH